MAFRFLFSIPAFAVIFQLAAGHSLLGEPRPMASKPCRLGGVPQRGGVALCPGPCDVDALQPPFRLLTSPHNPAAHYKRGEMVTIKYQRNNHGPGGFVRHTLVPLAKMMDKEAHARNAFHWGCWGANAAVAKKNELGRDKWGFSLVGGDGKLHNGKIGYYYNNVTIPPVVPDGVYVLGWVWYGGMGGSMKQNTLEKPHPVGLFADYWSCSFVEIKGGVPLKSLYKPMFVNDLKAVWKEGCNAANDAPGMCTYEPCVVPGRQQKPREFKNGKSPGPLTPEDFRTSSPDARAGRRFTMPTPVPYNETLRKALITVYSCRNPPQMKKMRKEDVKELQS